MARLFNGSSDKGQAALTTLSSYNKATIAYWLWWDNNSDDEKLAFEYSTVWDQNGWFNDPNQSGSTWVIGFSSTPNNWIDRVSRVSAGVWHHYVFAMDRVTPENLAWIDGSTVTVSSLVHNAAAYGNFVDKTLNFMCRNGASNFGAGRQSYVGLWGGVVLSQGEVTSLASGTHPSLVRPGSLINHWPMYGALSPEPDEAGGKAVTLSGTSVTAPPGKSAMPAGRLAVAA